MKQYSAFLLAVIMAFTLVPAWVFAYDIQQLSTYNGATPDEATKDEATVDHATKDEATKDEATKDEATKDESKPQGGEKPNVPNTPHKPNIPNIPDNPDKPEENYGLGDVNGSGAIDMMDYILLKRAYFGTFKLDEKATFAADVNRSGGIDMMDYILVKRAYFGTFVIT